PSFVPRPPFDDPDADVILRSSDDVDFWVHRAVLSLASPVFRTMFTLPQVDTDPDFPIIPVSESALLLDRALRFWYPGADIGAQTLGELREVLVIIILKYDMQFAVPCAKERLRRHLRPHPVAVFAIAYRHEWTDIAQEAAKASLALPLRTFGPANRSELQYISGDAYHILLQYHFECGNVAKLASSSLA
ncbi:hypothetical protein DFH09DRAFT_936424, partial [Mycena vulgaris]